MMPTYKEKFLFSIHPRFEKRGILLIFHKFREYFPSLKIAYIVLDRGYDAEEIHRILYEEYKIIPVIIRKKTAYPKGYTPEGIPLCIWGLPMSRTGIDYTRKRTRYACRKNCQRAKQMTFKCPYRDSSSSNGLIEYTNFKDSYRKYGPAIPDSIIYKNSNPCAQLLKETMAW